MGAAEQMSAEQDGEPSGLCLKSGLVQSCGGEDSPS